MKLRIFLKGAVAGAMIYAGAMAPQKADADLIRVANVSGDANVGSSTMRMRNKEGGELGYDKDDLRWLSGESPPGSPDNWLRVYSDQWNQFYSSTTLPLQIDNRPFSLEERGEAEFNKPFPLILDIQGTIAGSQLTGNYVQFQLQEGPDLEQGRRYYNGTLSLSQGVTFQDGTTSIPFSWDTTDSSIYTLPSVIGPSSGNITGAYASLHVVPSSIPEPGTLPIILLTGIAAVAASRRRLGRKNKN